MYNEDYLLKEGLKYPLLLIEIEKTNEKVLTNNINQCLLTVNLHIYSDCMGSTNSNDKNLENTLNHFRNVENIHRVIDGYNKPSNITPSGLTVDENYYSFGSFDRITSNNYYNKNIIHSIIGYQSLVFDESFNYRENPLIKEVSSITNTGNTYKINFN
jgi:hypothetical protein